MVTVLLQVTGVQVGTLTLSAPSAVLILFSFTLQRPLFLLTLRNTHLATQPTGVRGTWPGEKERSP